MTTPPFRPDRSPVVLWIMVGSAVVNAIPLIIGNGGPLHVAAVVGGAVIATLITRNRREARLIAQERANPRDEHHTMAELYEYRLLYHAHAANLWARHGTHFVAKSWKHSDGEYCFGGGWFIVTAHVGTGQVSNHYQADAWDLFQVPEMDTAPQWDGHTPDVAAKRLRAALPPENRNEQGERQ